MRDVSQFSSEMFSWIPESLSWLDLQGRRTEARKTLIKIARVNGSEFDDILMEITRDDHNNSEEERHCSFLDLCKYRRLRRFTIAIAIVW